MVVKDARWGKSTDTRASQRYSLVEQVEQDMQMSSIASGTFLAGADNYHVLCFQLIRYTPRTNVSQVLAGLKREEGNG